MALGASPRTISRLFFRAGMTPVLSGLLGGMLLSAATATTLQAYLFGIGAQDVTAHAGATIVVVSMCAIVVFAAARRVSGASVAEVLRSE